jgi:hypothetical protein
MRVWELAFIRVHWRFHLFPFLTEHVAELAKAEGTSSLGELGGRITGRLIFYPGSL